MFEGISTTALLIYLTLLVIVLVALTLFVISIYSGLLQQLDEVGTARPPIDQAVIAYKFQKGSYSAAGQIFGEATFIAPHNKTVGIYYDDPDKIDPDKTRCLVGSVLSEGGAPVNEELVKTFTDKGFKILHLPEVTYAVRTKFPHITTLSVLIAVHKAYPRMKSYIEEHKLCAYPFIEVYDGKSIHFMAPLSKQDEFFVPECEINADADQNSSIGDQTLLDASHSDLDESRETPQDLSQVSNESVTQGVQEDGHGDAVHSKMLCEIQAVAEDNGDSIGGNGEERCVEDEQASEDSSSSFEVLTGRSEVNE